MSQLEKDFVRACNLGNLEDAQLIYYIGGVDIHALNDNSFISACMNNQFEILKWLISLDKFDISVYNVSIQIACYVGKLEIAKWLDSIVKETKKDDSYTVTNDDIKLKNKTFRHVCYKGETQIETAKFLYSLGNVDINYSYDQHPSVFINACHKNQLQMAKWLYSLGGINIHDLNDSAFEKAYFCNNIIICEFLFDIDFNYFYKYLFNKSLIRRDLIKAFIWKKRRDPIMLNFFYTNKSEKIEIQN